MYNDFYTSAFIAYKSVTRGSKSMLVLMIFILALLYLNMMFISGVLAGLWNDEVNLSIDLIASDISISPQREPQVKQFIHGQSQLRAQLETIPGVTATARHYQLAGSLSYDRDNNGQLKSVSGAIIGIDPSDERKVLKLDTLTIAGKPLEDGDTDKIYISSALAGGFGTPTTNDLGGAKVGDKVQITFQNGYMRTYTIKGIYNDIMGIYETFITAHEAESVLGVYDNASQILMITDLSKDSIDDYESRVKAMVPNLRVQSFNDLLGAVASFENALRLISGIVSVISVAVAAVTIFVLIYVNAINKRRQIGILKAIGIKERIIVNAYIMQSLFYTLCGLVTGAIVVFGILRPFLIAYPIPIISGLMYVSLSFTAFDIVLSILAFIFAGFLAGRVPARLVARKDILTAIWG